MDAIRIEKLSVRPTHICVQVRVASFAHMSTPELAKQVMRTFPLIEQHACVNEEGSTFGLVINDTPLPHVMEHIVIALQVRAETEISATPLPTPAPTSASTPLPTPAPTSASTPLPILAPTSASAPLPILASTSAPAPASVPSRRNFLYLGTTEWIDEDAGLARIEVSFTDDLVALRAFLDAAQFLNKAVIP